MRKIAENLIPAQLGAYIGDAAFPSTRNELLRWAEDNDAPDGLLDVIEELPDRRYSDADEVIVEIAMYIRLAA